jgi:hypothetical protein
MPCWQSNATTKRCIKTLYKNPGVIEMR